MPYYPLSDETAVVWLVLAFCFPGNAERLLSVGRVVLLDVSEEKAAPNRGRRGEAARGELGADGLRSAGHERSLLQRPVRFNFCAATESRYCAAGALGRDG